MSAKRLVAALVAFADAAGTFQPGLMPVPGTGAVLARSTELLRTGVWLVISLAGTAFGIALSTSLISMLR